MIFKTKTFNSVSFLSLHFQVRFPKLLPLFGEQLSLRVIQGFTVNSSAAERSSQALLSRRDGAGTPLGLGLPLGYPDSGGGVCGGVNAPIWSPAPSLSSLLDCSVVHTVFHVPVRSPYSTARAPHCFPLPLARSGPQRSHSIMDTSHPVCTRKPSNSCYQ